LVQFTKVCLTKLSLAQATRASDCRMSRLIMLWEGYGTKISSLSPSISAKDLRKTTKHFVRIVSVLVEIRVRHLPDVSEMCQLAWLQEIKFILLSDDWKRRRVHSHSLFWGCYLLYFNPKQ